MATPRYLGKVPIIRARCLLVESSSSSLRSRRSEWKRPFQNVTYYRKNGVRPRSLCRGHRNQRCEMDLMHLETIQLQHDRTTFMKTKGMIVEKRSSLLLPTKAYVRRRGTVKCLLNRQTNLTAHLLHTPPPRNRSALRPRYGILLLPHLENPRFPPLRGVLQRPRERTIC